MRSILIGLAGLSVISSVAQAQTRTETQEDQPADTACTQTDAALPAEMIGWTHRPTLSGASKVAALKNATLSLGKGVDAVLPMTGKVAYPAPPKKPDNPRNHGGLFRFDIDRAGGYAIALGSAARIELVKDKAAVASAARSDGPPCSTILRVVDYKLTPGTYVLQVSAYADQKLSLMVARRP
jgi:hypothetical protein